VALELGLQVLDDVAVAHDEVPRLGPHGLVLGLREPHLLAAAVDPALAEVAGDGAVPGPPLLPARHTFVGDAKRRLGEGDALSPVSRHRRRV
jgi:hypothetical protein